MSATHSATDTAIRGGVVLLTLIAAAVHLSLLFPDPAFILNGLGYLTLLAALYLPIPQLAPYERIVRGFSTTAVEVALVILLLLEGRRMRSRRNGGL
jgi:hypothetical protein